MPDTKKWLSTAQAASMCGVTPRTLYRFLDEGRLKSYRIGRVIRVLEDDVEEFLESCIIEPGSLTHLYPDVLGNGNNEK